jgi:hypothetical protein
VAADLFYRPGGATARSIRALYDVIELEPMPTTLPVREELCQPSA